MKESVINRLDKILIERSGKKLFQQKTLRAKLLMI